MKMKAAVYHGPGDIRIEEVDRPTASDEGMVLKVGACGICPLIDVPHYKAEFSLLDIPAHYSETPVKSSNQILGHEFSGEVVEVGSKVTCVKKGDRLYGVIWGPCGKCDACKAGDYENCAFGDGGGRATPGAMAEYVLFPNMMYPSITDDKIVKLPDSLSFRDGAFIEILRLGIGMASKMKAAGDIVAVFGQDPIGLAAVIECKAKGASKVVAFDVSDKRLSIARELGADATINTLKEDVLQSFLKATGGKYANLVIESSCRPENLQNAVNVAAAFGDIWLGTFYTAGNFFNPSYVHPNMVSMNPTQKGGLSIHCPWGTLGPWKPMLERAVEMLASGQITAEKHAVVYPMDKVKEAFEAAVHDSDIVKVLIEP